MNNTKTIYAVYYTYRGNPIEYTTRCATHEEAQTWAKYHADHPDIHSVHLVMAIEATLWESYAPTSTSNG